jgi:hypothetical protein
MMKEESNSLFMGLALEVIIDPDFTSWVVQYSSSTLLGVDCVTIIGPTILGFSSNLSRT